MADNIQEEPLDVPKSNQLENQLTRLSLKRRTEQIAQIKKRKLWKYIIMLITTEREIGNRISGNFNVVSGSILRISGGVSVGA
ncbi:MAG: hypothetical protein IPL74_12815 [Bacteroidetes bacterium]|nr:hypothetical protein [Bacteroidota bacterium]